MNVLELCLSPGYGGLEMYPHKVLLHLRARGVSCRAVIAPGTLLASRVAEDGIPHEYLRPGSKVVPLVGARRLARWLDAWAIDVLHMHWGHDLSLAVLAKRLAKRRVKLVYTRQMALTRYKRDPYHRLLYREVDRFVTITQRLKAEAERFLPMPPGKIVHLYYGVPAPEPLSAEECGAFFDEHSVRLDVFKIGVFSRIQRLKGQHLAVEALKQLADKGIDAQLVLVGHVMDDDYFHRTMDEAKRLGVADRIRYAGFVKNPSGLMACFDAVALPSYGETFGLVVAESMRAGTAVVGSDGGGVPEMIRDGETGLLFQEGDASSLAARLEEIVWDGELRAALAGRAKVFADYEFDESKHYARLMEIFEDVLRE